MGSKGSSQNNPFNLDNASEINAAGWQNRKKIVMDNKSQDCEWYMNYCWKRVNTWQGRK